MDTGAMLAAKLEELAFQEITDLPKGMKAQEGFSMVPQRRQGLFVRVSKLIPTLDLTLAFIPLTGQVFASFEDLDLTSLGFADISDSVLREARERAYRTASRRQLPPRH